MENYNVIMFNDGEVLATTNSILYFSKHTEPKLIASKLTREDAFHLEKVVYNDGILYKALNNFLSENRSWIQELKDTLKEMTEKKEDWVKYAIKLEHKVQELEEQLGIIHEH